MDELDATIGSDPHEPGLFGRGKRIRVDRGRDGPRQSSGAQQCVARRRRQRPSTRRDERAQAVWNRQRDPVTVVASVDETGDLQRVQRAASGRRRDSNEGGARKTSAKVAREDAVK
jgi:hypothetical protein